MRLSLLFTDQAAVRACIEVGRASEAWKHAPATDRAAVSAANLRLLARDAASCEGAPTTGNMLHRADAGTGGAASDRLTIRYLHAYRSLAAAKAPTSAEALAAAYALLDADAVHVAPDREQALVHTAAEALAATMTNSDLGDLDETIMAMQSMLTGRRERRLFALSFPFFVGHLFEFPLPLPAARITSDEALLSDELERIAKAVQIKLAGAGGLRTHYSTKLEHERATSKSLRVATLSMVFPVLTQAMVERELGLSGRGALNILQRLADPAIAILEEEPGNAVARRVFRNPGAAQLLS